MWKVNWKFVDIFARSIDENEQSKNNSCENFIMLSISSLYYCTVKKWFKWITMNEWLSYLMKMQEVDLKLMLDSNIETFRYLWVW